MRCPASGPPRAHRRATLPPPAAQPVGRAAPPGPSAPTRREPEASPLRRAAPAGAARSRFRGADTIARLDHDSFRAEFPVLAERAYLNAGTDGPLPARSVAAAHARLEHELREGRSGSVHWDGLEQLREENLVRSIPGRGTFVL